MDEPEGRSRGIRHDVAPLHLDCAGGVVEMNCDASQAFQFRHEGEMNEPCCFQAFLIQSQF